MDKQHFFGAAGETAFHPAALIMLVVCGVLIFALPRRYVFVPLLVAAILIPGQQKVMIGGLHFTLPRILLLLGWMRLLLVRIQAGRSGIRWTTLDSVFVAYCLSNAIMYSLLWGESGAVINRLGFLYNALGIYFFIRYFVRDTSDIRRVTTTFAWILIAVAVCMLNEQVTQRNVFSVFGGVPPVTEVRGDKLRSQGPFAHPLTAGTVGATLCPIMLGLCWHQRKKRKIAVAGSAACVAMALTSMSSTPVLALGAGLFALFLWPARRYLVWMRWGAVAALIVLHLVMKAPVWALIGRIDLTGSSSSYHRYQLVDQAIRRVGEWWVFGTRDTSSWGWDMWDTINSYVAAGTDGGLLTLILFVAIFAVAFHQLGAARRVWRSDFENTRRMWALSAMLFAHTVAFFGIGYFDQSSVPWYTGLALIGTAVSLKSPARQPAVQAELATPPASFSHATPSYEQFA